VKYGGENEGADEVLSDRKQKPKFRRQTFDAIAIS